MDLYRSVVRPLLFSPWLNADPEWLHHRTMGSLRWLDQHRAELPWQTGWQRLERSFQGTDLRLAQTLWGLHFPNPVGLAAGFDKDGVASGIWSALGFGFAELGTVTAHPQPGNDRPRLFRLTPDRAILNRMCFNNAGAKALADRLRHRWGDTPHPIPLGINLGKSKVTPLEVAATDYGASFQYLQSLGDYFVVNVSSPNTPGLRSLQAADQLAQILETIQTANHAQKPLLVKIAPDLEWAAIADVIHLATTYRLSGIIATHTPIRRDHLQTRYIRRTGNPVTEEAGGISGAPLHDRAIAVVRFLHQKTQGTLPIIGVGGIFTAADAWDFITAGASLVQVYTGWVYEGPWMVRRLLAGLGQRLEEGGFDSLTDAIGAAHT